MRAILTLPLLGLRVWLLAIPPHRLGASPPRAELGPRPVVGMLGRLLRRRGSPSHQS